MSSHVIPRPGAAGLGNLGGSQVASETRLSGWWAKCEQASKGGLDGDHLHSAAAVAANGRGHCDTRGGLDMAQSGAQGIAQRRRA